MAMDDGPASLTATQAAAEIARGALSAEDYVRACLERIEAVDATVKPFVHLDPVHVVSQAQELDELRRNGRPTGPLHGIPVAIQDVIDTGDYPTELGSPLFSGRRPLRDATVVARLRAAGAIILGKTGEQRTGPGPRGSGPQSTRSRPHRGRFGRGLGRRGCRRTGAAGARRADRCRRD